ncbi:hypothetical protein HKX48_005073 [Thoreauomyces humboldtii]|nr:hypothetical protein HKX48_005073 [Thoreauomyces humboldtii]
MGNLSGPETDNPFLRPSTPTFTTHRGNDDYLEDEDDADSGFQPTAITPLPRRKPQKSKSSLSIEVGLSTPRQSRSGPFKAGVSKLSLRRNSDASGLAEDSDGADDMFLNGTPRLNRRGSVYGKSLVRIAALLRDETNPLDKEIAHEKAINTNQTALFVPQTPGGGSMPDGMQEDMPPESPSFFMEPSNPSLPRSMSMGTPNDVDRGLSPDDLVPVPVRAVAIPNSALKDPATYVSHSSKLNPENNASPAGF